MINPNSCYIPSYCMHCTAWQRTPSNLNRVLCPNVIITRGFAPGHHVKVPNYVGIDRHGGPGPVASQTGLDRVVISFPVAYSPKQLLIHQRHR